MGRCNCRSAGNRRTGTLACCDCRVLVPPPSLSPAAVSLILVRVAAPSQRTDGGPSSRCGEETEKTRACVTGRDGTIAVGMKNVAPNIPGLTRTRGPWDHREQEISRTPDVG